MGLRYGVPVVCVFAVSFSAAGAWQTSGLPPSKKELEAEAKAQIAEAAAKLEKALDAGPEQTRSLHYDLALCYQKLGDRKKTLEHLNSAIAETQNAKERIALLELRTQVILGGKVADASSDDLVKNIDGFNQAYLETDNNAVAAAGLCDRMKGFEAAAPANRAVVFDQAKCAEEDGRDADAAKLLGKYLELSPDALDGAEVQLHQADLLSLAALEGVVGDHVRAHFAAADLDLDYRRYDRAIDEYRAAEKLVPSFPLVAWRLALLYEASGDVSRARECFERYLGLDSGPEQKQEAQRHLDSLDQWRSYYDDSVNDAHELLGDLLLHSMGLSSEGIKHRAKLNKQQKKISAKYQRTLSASEALSGPFVRRQLDLARDDLEQAVELFPTAPEANQMLALVQLEDNDWPSAFHSFDAVASAGQPASFYAQVNSSEDKKIVLATKVEIGKDAVRFVYLSSYDAKKKMSVPPTSPAGDDDLGNLSSSASAEAEDRVIPLADLEDVRTDKSFIIMKLHKQQIMLAPVYMVAYTPVEGRVAREFGNEYTRMFVRYLGYEQARLGKEGMTFGEKLRLGYTFMQTGMSFFDAVASGGINSYEALQETLKLAHALRTDTSNLRRLVREQRNSLEGLEFKAIPNHPAQLVFRDHF